jgi:5-methylcytosine-specific restriction endonuclease McrA
VDYYHDGIWPTCKCGCGQQTNWQVRDGKFGDFIRGHISRIKNNWGHNKKAIEKSAETRRQQFANGEREVWNKGLTKENDLRVKQYGCVNSKNFTQERKDRYSDIMRENRLNGVVPSLTGSAHPQWNGGSSTIQQIARGSKKHYDTWKYPILKRDNFTCQHCGSTNDLQVHHDDIEFSEIVGIILEENVDLANSEWFEDKKILADKIIEYHVEHNISGITICHECHCELHPSLNL